MSEKIEGVPPKRNVGPGGIYNLHIETSGDGIPIRVWRLNERGRSLRERLLSRVKAQEAEREAHEEGVLYHFGEGRLEAEEEDEEPDE